VQALLRTTPMRLLPLEQLARRRPDGMAELALATIDSAPLPLARDGDRIQPERLARLLELFDESPGLFLEQLPAATRRMLFLAHGTAWRDHEGAVAADVVGILPRLEREAEARRILALPALATRPLARMGYI